MLQEVELPRPNEYAFEPSDEYPPFVWRFIGPNLGIVAKDREDDTAQANCRGYCGIRSPHTQAVHDELVKTAGGENGLN